MTRPVLLVIISAIVGTVLTIVSVYPFGIGSSTAFVSQSGFPLPWTSFVGIPCGQDPYESNLVMNGPCLSSYYTSYDWLAFAADVMFYLFLTLGLLLVYTKYRIRKPTF